MITMGLLHTDTFFKQFFTHTLTHSHFWSVQTGIRAEPMGVCDVSRAHTLLHGNENKRRTGDSRHVPLAVHDPAQTESSGTFLSFLILYNVGVCS